MCTTYCASGAKSKWLSDVIYRNIKICNSKGNSIKDIYIFKQER